MFNDLYFLTHKLTFIKKAFHNIFSFNVSLFSLFWIIFISPKALGQSPSFDIQGVLLEKGTKIPLKDVNIFILPQKLKATTNTQGQFTFTNVTEGTFLWVVNLTGYNKLEQNDQQLGSSENKPRRLYLEKIEDTGFETTVVGAKKKKDSSQKTLTQKEFLSMPGANGDPVKAVQNLPGVSRTGGFSSQVAIQGSEPKDTIYDIDGHQIPLVFHFGGLTSVVIPEALSEVNYLSAGYGAYYSRAMGGIISLQTESETQLDRPQKGFFFMDTLKAGGMYQKQIDESSSILIGGRLSYVGQVVGKILEKRADFNLTVAPEFSDFTVIHKKKLNDQDELKTVLVVSKDELGFLLKQPVDEEPSFRGDFKNTTQFYRLIPQWRHQWDAETVSELSLGYGEDKIETIFGSNFFNLKSNVLSVRGDHTFKYSPQWIQQIGFDHLYRNSKVVTRVPRVNNEGGVMSPVGSSETVDLNVSAKLNDLGIFWRNEVNHNEWTFIPALRWDQFRWSQENHLNPRMEIKNKISESLESKLAWGQYVQEPLPQEISPDYGNPDLKSPKAEHWALGFEKDFREGDRSGWRWSGTFFHRLFSRLVMPSSQPVIREGVLTTENYNNNGSGKASGFETLVRFTSEDWSLWLAYTYSKSTRTFPPRPETVFQYDQTHSLNLILTKPLGSRWTLATRYRYTTGNPYTPVVGGIFDADADVYLPVRGAFYSERYKPFSQLDLRADKKWILDEQVWSFYMDLQNVLNTPNSENLRYSYDYSQSTPMSGLPIIPSLGVKGEF